MAMASPSLPSPQLSPPQMSPMGPPPVGVFSGASLYVGDLDVSLDDAQLYDYFNQFVPVVSVRIPRDQVTGESLGYGYVNFHNHQDATRALKTLNFTTINKKPIRIMFSNRDPSMRKSGHGNIFIKNLDPTIDNKTLHETFASFGTVLSCKVASDSSGKSRGYAFVQFEHEESAQKAISQLNGMLFNNRKVYVGLFIRRQERDRVNGSPKFTNVFVKNLSESVTKDNLIEMFKECGPINSAIVMTDEKGNSRGFGFVNFDNHEDAAVAVEKFNGKVYNEKLLYVGRAQKKAEREAELRAKYEQERYGRLQKLQGANLFLKNLDDTCDDEKLFDLFSKFGTITSCKVMTDSLGQSKGYGFVAFSSPEEANRVLREMNGKMVGRKPLYVAVAQRKEERRATLQAKFSQVRSPGPLSPAMPTMSYHPGAPRLAPQHLYYGQGTAGLVPPQPAGFGFQQQLVPGFRPGVAPNFMIPYDLQRHGQLGHRMGIRRSGVHQQPQPRNANPGFRYLQNARNIVYSSMMPQGPTGHAMPFNMSGNSMVPMDAAQSPPIPISALASSLASATPENQHSMLGEQLYPLVERIEGEHAGKVTGMLLEMDQTEVLHLIESPEVLKKKVYEAMEVLRSHSTGSDAADRSSSLTLND
ncbi:uncharacterized protein A4U43_C08F5860 [Asparagus officinalis]|uniref:polyadenylate-binding protein 3-like n=1 Tax=Asparagus officinalis TaxID=4686 RepID=UPI00098E4EC9|nr:polyadenylate-binding protein 3-like [Asparagus officinalis]ONK59382.1 uncharacterized protein A4U43_C08F5860 [Asparagus officinalis]